MNPPSPPRYSRSHTLPIPTSYATSYRRRHDSGLNYVHGAELMPSPIDHAFMKNYASSALFISRLRSSASVEKDSHKSRVVPEYIFVPDLDDCIFTGHTNTDLDSVACAVAAADLYKGGVAALSSEINSETEYCLKRWGIQKPQFFNKIEGKASKRVCLVDHNQKSQCPEGLIEKNVVGVIDHHALQNGTICTDATIFVDIRPWGSCCTILAHHYLLQNKKMSPHIAGILLSGIISDTLNLQSPTTTKHDSQMVVILAQVEDVNKLANEQFRAKSAVFATMSPHQLICGDRKRFTIQGYTIGFSTCESFGGMDELLERSYNFAIELRALKKEQELHFNFLSLVDVEKKKTFLVLSTKAEIEFAKKAYGQAYGQAVIDSLEEGKDGIMIMDLGEGKISRKKNFIPPLSNLLVNDGWKPSEKLFEPDPVEYGPVVTSCRTDDECGLGCCVVYRKNFKGFVKAIMLGRRLSKNAKCKVKDETEETKKL
eukprot:g6003.t1